MVDYLARPHQMKVIKSQKKYPFIGGGVGCGKTDIGSLWSLNKCKQTPQSCISIIAANSYAQLIDSTIRNMFKNFKQWGVKFHPSEVPKTHRPFSVFVWNGRHWVEMLCRSLDSFELLSGTEVGWIWVDECWMTKKEAIDVLVARLRDKRMLNQMLFTTTLDEPDTWMYEMFVEEYKDKIMDVVYATTYDNLKNLPEDYVEDLKALYSEPMFNRMVMSKWVTLAATAVYYAFDRTNNVVEPGVELYDPNSPILWTHDFNIAEGKPMSSALAHIKRGQYGTKVRPELHFFDEIIIDGADTTQAITEFQEREWFQETRSNVIIYGDATGRSKDTRSKTTDYRLLADAGFAHQKVPAKNPAIRDRHNSFNAMLRNMAGDVRIKIHPRCKHIIKGLETGRLKEGAQYVEEETRTQHVTSACGYLVNREFPLIRPITTQQEI